MEIKGKNETYILVLVNNKFVYLKFITKTNDSIDRNNFIYLCKQI